MPPDGPDDTREESIYDIAHLGHLELLTPKFDESRRFFVDVMGMTESGQAGSSVFLRGWDDYERYSLKLTASNTSGIGHMAFRTRSPQALQRRARASSRYHSRRSWPDGRWKRKPSEESPGSAGQGAG